MISILGIFYTFQMCCHSYTGDKVLINHLIFKLSQILTFWFKLSQYFNFVLFCPFNTQCVIIVILETKFSSITVGPISLFVEQIKDSWLVTRTISLETELVTKRKKLVMTSCTSNRFTPLKSVKQLCLLLFDILFACIKERYAFDMISTIFKKTSCRSDWISNMRPSHCLVTSSLDSATNSIPTSYKIQNGVTNKLNKMELLQSQAPIDWELYGSSASARHGTFDIGH